MWQLKKDIIIFLRRLSYKLVPLQAITGCFLRDFAWPPGRVTWVPSPEARGELSRSRTGWLGSCHALVVLYLARCGFHNWRYEVRDGTELLLLASHSSLTPWGYEVLCVFKVQHRKSSMVLAANHSAAVITVTLKGFLDGIKHMEIYRREQKQGKFFCINVGHGSEMKNFVCSCYLITSSYHSKMNIIACMRDNFII